MLAQSTLPDRFRPLLENLDTTVHGDDDMWRQNAGEYLMVGLGAIELLDDALSAAGRPAPGAILDLPSGYGRVARLLRSHFPEAEIDAGDVNPQAARFCARRFEAHSVVCDPDPGRVSLRRRFDLVWCGSLLTHLQERDSEALLKLLTESLNPDGVIVATTHGGGLAKAPDGTWDSGLGPEARQQLRSDLAEAGFGWQPYHGAVRYGTSLVAHRWLTDRARNAGLEELWFRERGWSNYQDAIALRATPILDRR